MCSGSQVDLITSELAARIGTPRSGETVLVQSIGGGEVQTSQGQITFDILIPGDKARPLTCHILQNVVGDLLTCRLTSKFLDQFTSYRLADPRSTQPLKSIYSLAWGIITSLSCQTWYNWNLCICSTLCSAGLSQASPFVRGVSGTTPGPLPLGSHYVATRPAGYLSNDSTGYVCGVVADNGLLEFQRFWETEEAPDTTTQFLSSEAKFCVTHYNNTTRYDADGRSRVALPFKPDAPTLGNSKAQALRRFLSLEARLKVDDKFRDAYQKFMAEFIDLGHLELVPTAELGPPRSPGVLPSTPRRFEGKQYNHEAEGGVRRVCCNDVWRLSERDNRSWPTRTTRHFLHTRPIPLLRHRHGSRRRQDVPTSGARRRGEGLSSTLLAGRSSSTDTDVPDVQSQLRSDFKQLPRHPDPAGRSCALRLYNDGFRPDR